MTAPISDPSGEPQRGRSWFHLSNVIVAVLAVVSAALTVWGALASQESNERGAQNTDLQQQVDALQQQNSSLADQVKKLTGENGALRSAAAVAPTGNPVSPSQPLPDEASWKVPADLHGTWRGTVVTESGSTRFDVTVTLHGNEQGKGREAGSMKYPTRTDDCLAKLYIVELRSDGSLRADPGSDQGPCANLLRATITLSLREGRVWFQTPGTSGALTKVS